MTNSSVDGFIIVATDGIREEIEQLKAERIPFVLIDRKLPDVETNYVILNNVKGSYDLTNHLISNQYKTSVIFLFRMECHRWPIGNLDF